MVQAPECVVQPPEGVAQAPESVVHPPDFLLFWQDIQDISGSPGGVTIRFMRTVIPCRTAQSARGR